MTAMEERLEQADAIREDNEEYQELNELLVRELEKRDRAIQEAVEMICQLEEKVETLETSLRETIPLSAGTDEQHLGLKAHEVVLPSSPPSIKQASKALRPVDPSSNQLSNLVFPAGMPSHFSHRGSPNLPRSLLRTPSFLTSTKGSTGALRSLYLAGEVEGTNGSRAITFRKQGSAFTGDSATNGSPDGQIQGLDSPRLSVLSESSFVSVYGGNRQTDGELSEVSLADDHDEDSEEGQQHGGDQADIRGDRTMNARVERWISDRTMHSKPRRSLASPEQEEEFGSVEGFRQIAARQLDEVTPMVPQLSQRYAPATMDPKRAIRKDPRSEVSLLQGPIFEGGVLPPTPDTLSTIDQDGLNATSGSVLRNGSSDGPLRTNISPAQEQQIRSTSELVINGGQEVSQTWGMEENQGLTSFHSDIDVSHTHDSGSRSRQHCSGSTQSTFISPPPKGYQLSRATSYQTPRSEPDETTKPENVGVLAAPKPEHDSLAAGNRQGLRPSSVGIDRPSLQAPFEAITPFLPAESHNGANEINTPDRCRLPVGSSEKTKFASRMAKQLSPGSKQTTKDPATDDAELGSPQTRLSNMSMLPASSRIGVLAAKLLGRGGSVRAMTQLSNVPLASSGTAVSAAQHRPQSLREYGRSVSANAILNVLPRGGLKSDNAAGSRQLGKPISSALPNERHGEQASLQTSREQRQARMLSGMDGSDELLLTKTGSLLTKRPTNADSKRSSSILFSQQQFATDRSFQTSQNIERAGPTTSLDNHNHSPSNRDEDPTAAKVRKRLSGIGRSASARLP